jgi:hypothetical protein
MDLPGSFDAYLKDRSPGTRKGLKSKLRRIEREDAAVVPVAAAPSRPRSSASWRCTPGARRQGEDHPDVDDRLAALLAALPSGEVDLRLFELRGSDGAVAGVTVRLDHGGTGYFYNAGIDPDRGTLSPGVVLELASIRDAIDRGLERFDFGPGDYRYKRDLGGVETMRFRAVASSRTLRGVALYGARAARDRLRSHAGGSAAT